jgi:hypothetical protein
MNKKQRRIKKTYRMWTKKLYKLERRGSIKKLIGDSVSVWSTPPSFMTKVPYAYRTGKVYLVAINF